MWSYWSKKFLYYCLHKLNESIQHKPSKTLARCLIVSDNDVQTEAENKQLRAKLKQMTTTRDQNKVCIDQLLSRLREMEAARRSEQSTADALRQQVNAYREDFEGERLDRHRAQERVVNLERQVAALKHRVRVTLCLNIVIIMLYLL